MTCRSPTHDARTYTCHAFSLFFMARFPCYSPAGRKRRKCITEHSALTGCKLGCHQCGRWWGGQRSHHVCIEEACEHARGGGWPIQSEGARRCSALLFISVVDFILTFSFFAFSITYQHTHTPNHADEPTRLLFQCPQVFFLCDCCPNLFPFSDFTPLFLCMTSRTSTSLHSIN